VTRRLTGSACSWGAPMHRGATRFFHSLFGEATGRPKKMEATCLIDHKWRYNEDLSTPRRGGAGS
jgi:hypothetical protein